LGNGITSQNISNLDELVCHLENEYPDEIWYATYGEVAENFSKANYCPNIGKGVGPKAIS
jgi:hypothetical protein